MFRMKVCAGALLALGWVGAAQAVPVVYDGTLSPGVSASGSVGGTSWADEVAAQVDFWRFAGVAGSTINLQVTRVSADLDPAFTLYSGVTTAEQNLFLNDADWGGLTYLTFADDELPNPGPGGDPALQSYTLPLTGNYTVAVGGFQSTTSGAYNYNISLGVAAPIPEPAITVLMAGGLLGVAWLGRRSRAGRRATGAQLPGSPADPSRVG